MENKKLTDLDFSVRALNSFKQNNFVNLSDILNIDERVLKDLNFSNRTIKEVMKYKTMQQLNSETNIGNFYCKCLNSGVNSFTGMCSNCEMSKGSGKLLQQKEELFQFNEKSAEKEKIKNLISSTPNDQKLGRLIRQMYSER